MLEEQYRKYFQEITPSDALNEETFVLMKEAQDHRAAPPPKPLRWKPAVVASATGTVAAALVAVIVAGFWLHGGKKTVEIEDMAGSLDVVVNNSANSAVQESDPANDADGSDAEEPTESAPQTQEPEAVPEESESVSEPEEQPEKFTQEESASTAPESTGSTSSADPREPDLINDGNTVTYTSIREFLTALAAKETPGYGSNYYNARELIIVPSRLPDNARFRHFHLNTETGKYSYSYLFTAGGKEYFLDIDVNAKPPKTLRDLNLQKEAIATEELGTGKKGNQLFYLFGQNDYITVTLTEVNSTVALTEEQVAALLANFQLERCSLTNAVLDMKY